jgi:Protein of unknown function (DUF1838)
MTMQASFSTSRRQLLQGVAGAAAVSAAGLAGAATGNALPTDERLRRFLMMRGALDERLVIGEIDAQFHAVIDGQTVPLCGLLAVTFTRWQPQGDGSWLSASFEHVYYTDIPSGAVLTQWRNPVTGRSVPVPPYSSKPSVRRLKPDLSFETTQPLPPGATMEDRVNAAYEDRGEQVFVERVQAVLPRPGQALPYAYGELVTLRAPLAALRDAKARQVRTRNSFSSVSGWRPWMQMGDQPGHVLGHGSGNYGLTLDEVSPVWLAAARAGGLDWLADPASRLLPLLAAASAKA